jgi:hypothetical protein
MTKQRSKKVELPQPPAPYITPPEWMREAKEEVDSVRSSALKLSLAKQALETGACKVDEYEITEEELIKDIEYHATNAVMAMDRAATEADRAEAAKQEALDVLRDAWAKMRKLVA